MGKSKKSLLWSLTPGLSLRVGRSRDWASFCTTLHYYEHEMSVRKIPETWRASVYKMVSDLQELTISLR